MELSKAHDLMTTQVITVRPEQRFVEAVRCLADHHISCILVTRHGLPVGIITERDVARVAVRTPTLHDVLVDEVMTRELVTCRAWDDAAAVLDKMRRHRVRRVVVLGDDGRLEGLITYSDFLRQVAEDSFKAHRLVGSVMSRQVLTVPPEAPLHQAVHTLVRERKSCLVVMADAALVGIVTERDVVRLVAAGTPLAVPTGDVCTRNVVYTSAAATIHHALGVMLQHHIRRLVVLDDGLKVQGVITQTDILGVVQESAAAGLRSHLRHFQDSLDTLETGGIELELDGGGAIVWTNHVGADLLGLPRASEAVGHSLSRLLLDPGAWKRFVHSSGGQPGTRTVVFELPRRALEFSLRLSRYTAHGIFKDVTAAHRERAAVRADRDRLHQVLQSHPEGILVLDECGRFCDANNRAAELFESSREELLGHHHAEPRYSFLDAQANPLPAASTCLGRALALNAPVRDVVHGLRRRDGGLLWVRVTATPALDTQGRTREVVAVLTDVTELFEFRRQHELILETAREGYWEVSLEGQILRVNAALSTQLGFAPQELLGKSIFELVDSENRQVFASALARRGSGASDTYEVALRRKDGSQVDAIVAGSPLRLANAPVLSSFAFLTDITDLKSTHRTLRTIAAFSKDITRVLGEREAYEVLRRHLLSLRNGDARLNAIHLTSTRADQGLVEEVICHEDQGLPEVHRFQGFDRCRAYIYSGTFINRDITQETTCPAQRCAAKTGSHMCTAIHSGGSIAGVLNLYSATPNFFSDVIRETLDSLIALFAPAITNLRLLETNRKLAVVDPLSGLFNRRYFEAFMDTQLAIASRSAQPLSVAMLDADNFKNVNDTHGHDAGDLALKTIADVITRCIRTSDVAIRYGGEEFVVVLPNTPGDMAAKSAERIRAAVEATPVFLGPGRRLQLTVSLGVASVGPATATLDAVMAAADAALYQAKQTGKNRVCSAPGVPREDPPGPVS